MNGTAAQHPGSLAFEDATLERAYREHRAQAVLPQFRVILPATGVLWAASSWLDLAQGGADAALALRLRFSVAVPAAVLVSLLGWAPRRVFDRLWEAGLVVASVAIGGSMVLASALLSEASAPLVLTGLALGMVATHTILPTRFALASLTSGTLAVAYMVAVTVVAPLPSVTQSVNVFFVLAAQAVGMLGSYHIEQYQRRDFVQTRLLDAERERADGLLLNVLPAPIAERLKRSAGRIADHFPEVTVLFADIVGFTPLAERTSPGELVALLDRIFTDFDDIAERHGVEKIKTIGDAYMAVGGVPDPRADHAHAVVAMALEMLAVVDRHGHAAGVPLRMRIGVHSGPVVAGIIGKRKFSYDLWGDTVNTASRMESHGVDGAVQITEATCRLIQDRYAPTPRGTVGIKGKGELAVWLLRPPAAPPL